MTSAPELHRQLRELDSADPDYAIRFVDLLLSAAKGRRPATYICSPSGKGSTLAGVWTECCNRWGSFRLAIRRTWWRV